MWKRARVGWVVAILLSLIIAVALGACQAPAPPAATPVATQPVSAQPTPVSAPSNVPSPTKAPVSAKQVNVLLHQEPDTLMPAIGQMLAAEQVMGALWTNLVIRDDKNEYVAWGAESVPTLDNGGARFVGEGPDRFLEITYKIKRDLKWHDGNPVTSADVKFSIELMQNPDFPALQRKLALKVHQVRTPDDKTAVVEFLSERQAREAASTGGKYQRPDFYVGFEKQVGPVIDPLFFMVGDAGNQRLFPAHILSKIDPKDMEKSDFARRPVGNGPYKFKDWVPGQHIVVEAAGTSVFGPPNIQTVVFRLMADSTAILNALAAGEGHATTQGALDLDQSPELDQLAKQGKIQPYHIPATGWEHLDFNLDHEFLGDKNVRKAIAHAIDRQAMVDNLLYGKSQVMHSWIAPPHWAIDESAMVTYQYDLAKAKDLLAAAGFTPGPDGILQKGGKPFQIKLQTTTAKIRQAVAPVVQANLKDVGIAVELDFIPGFGLFDREGPLVKRTFETALYRWSSDPDPDPTAIYHSQFIPTEANNWAGSNIPGWRNREADELMMKAASTLSRKDRKPMYGRLLSLWTDELPTLPLFQTVNVSAASPNLRNFKPTPTNTPETWNLHEWMLADR